MKATGRPKATVLELALLGSPKHLIDDIKTVYRKAVEDGTTYQEAAPALGTPTAMEAAQKLLLFEKYYNSLSSDELYMELYVLPEVEQGKRPLFWEEEHWY
jgi:predicted glycosyltransferase